MRSLVFFGMSTNHTKRIRASNCGRRQRCCLLLDHLPLSHHRALETPARCRSVSIPACGILLLRSHHRAIDIARSRGGYECGHEPGPQIGKVSIPGVCKADSASEGLGTNLGHDGVGTIRREVSEENLRRYHHAGGQVSGTTFVFYLQQADLSCL